MPKRARLTNYISLGVLTKTVPMRQVHQVLAATGTASQRQRDFPAHVVVYYVTALALYLQVACREVSRHLVKASGGSRGRCRC